MTSHRGDYAQTRIIVRTLATSSLTCIICRREVQLGRDVCERDPAVGKVDPPETGADHIVVQARDQVVSTVGEELGAVRLGNLMVRGQ